MDEHLPLPTEELERRLVEDPFTVLEVEATPGGISGASKLRLLFDDCTALEVKWRAAPGSGGAYNNDPRKELAAYAIQKLFLDPADYVVPVTAGVCVPTDQLLRIGAAAEPQMDGAGCVFGTMAVWLSNVTEPDDVLDAARFERSVVSGESENYATRFAHLNLLTYLIRHLDLRAGNVLVSDHPESRRLFAVDNGLAFSGIGNPNPWILNMTSLKVNRLPAPALSRLRALTGRDIQRALETIVQFRMSDDGRVDLVAPTPPLSREDGVRTTPRTWQLGLTHGEIAAIEERIGKLLGRIDRRYIVPF